MDSTCVIYKNLLRALKILWIARHVEDFSKVELGKGGTFMQVTLPLTLGELIFIGSAYGYSIVKPKNGHNSFFKFWCLAGFANHPRDAPLLIFP